MDTPLAETPLAVIDHLRDELWYLHTHITGPDEEYVEEQLDAAVRQLNYAEDVVTRHAAGDPSADDGLAQAQALINLVQARVNVIKTLHNIH